MCQFLETIKIENGVACHLHYHWERLMRTVRSHFKNCDPPNLETGLAIPEEYRTGLFKCRVIYGKTIHKIEFENYVPYPIKTLKLLHDNTVEYSYKYADRSRLSQLLKMKGRSDDILIIKNGWITDTSYCNILFFNGKRWITPATPLLKGVCRERLLHTGQISEEIIHVNDITGFSKFMLINAMLDFDEKRAEDVGGIEG
jgi:4-amino-4-deoxychorismate lyase